MLLTFNPACTQYTAVSPAGDGSSTLIGQLRHTQGKRSAQLSYLLPSSAVNHSTLPALLDTLAYHAGQMGALNLVGEVGDCDPLFEVLRQNLFSVYATQVIYSLAYKSDDRPDQESQWKPAAVLPDLAARNLYQSLVPPIVQSADPFDDHTSPRLIYMEKDEVMAWVECFHGPNGLVLQPLFHPAVHNVRGLLMDLLAQLPVMDLPVYILVRSYQAWLEPVLQEMGGKCSPRQALLTRMLAVAQRSAASRAGVLNQRKAETTSPLASPYNKTFTEPQDEVEIVRSHYNH